MLIPSLLAPFFGLLGAAALMTLVIWVIRKRAPGLVNRVFRRLQLISGGFVAFTHGTNDAQKTMGIIALALISSGHLSAEPFTVPVWVKISAATAMAHRDVRRRLADHPHARAAGRQARSAAGLRGADLVCDCALGHGAVRLPRLDDAHDQRLGARRGREHPPLRRALGSRGEHRGRVGPDDSVRRARRRGDGGDHAAARRSRLRRLLTIVIAALAFLARSIECSAHEAERSRGVLTETQNPVNRRRAIQRPCSSLPAMTQLTLGGALLVAALAGGGSPSGSPRSSESAPRPRPCARSSTSRRRRTRSRIAGRQEHDAWRRSTSRTRRESSR